MALLGKPLKFAFSGQTASRHRLMVTVPAYPKLVDVVLVLLDWAQKQGYEVTQYDLVKSVFIADRRRLNEFDRPITYDVYEAQLHGPVPLTVFKMLKDNEGVLAKTGPVAWKRRRVSEGSKKYHYFEPARAPNLGLFAPNDVRALREALDFVISAGVKAVRAKTHEDVAYRQALHRKSANRIMNYTLLRDDKDPRLTAKIVKSSQESAAR